MYLGSPCLVKVSSSSSGGSNKTQADMKSLHSALSRKRAGTQRCSMRRKSAVHSSYRRKKSPLAGVSGKINPSTFSPDGGSLSFRGNYPPFSQLTHGIPKLPPLQVQLNSQAIFEGPGFKLFSRRSLLNAHPIERPDVIRQRPEFSQRPHNSLLLVLRSRAGLPLRKRDCVHRLPIAQ